ncbi:MULTISPECIES: hypothetical protein [Kitasatospora]|uniref:hypothetical protein n=1 Tax=Kitasatospora TaxID=2063 RepID=UPI00247681D3|nr:hypothetical protein [Kitasatospora sp. GP30]MDH6144044.1 hypothetical protein [Kitasatospora sp. GP30]
MSRATPAPSASDRALKQDAQDWHVAFGFNQDDTTIPVVDGLGVAPVCIEALNRRVDELTARSWTACDKPRA